MILLVLLSLLSITSLTAFLQWLFKYFTLRKKLAAIPAPKNLPFLGLSLQVSRIPREDRLKWISNLCYKFKDGILVIWLGTEPFVQVRKPQQIGVILSSSTLIKKSSIYDTLKIWLGDGLILSTGEHWFHHRRLITPAFHFSVLEEYAAVMSEKVEILNECIQEKYMKAPNVPINIFDLATKFTLDVICETAMGVNIDVLRNVNVEYGQALHTLAYLVSERFIRPWLKWDFFYYFTKSGRKMLNCVKIMHEFTEKVIRKKQLERQRISNKDKEQINISSEISQSKRKAFLDLLLDENEKNENKLSFKELREEVDTFMFAGHDTTSTAISWALFCLGNAFEVQNKVHEELKEVFGSSDEVATTKELTKLKYMDRVIKETLRMYPSVPAVSRNLVHDTVIDGYLIPKGTFVSLQIYQLNHDPEIWKDPETFDPDRFLPERSNGRHPFAYVPFSAGPRNCIGQKFAILELKTTLTAVLRKWKVKSVLSHSEIKPVQNIILRPHDEKIDLLFTPINMN